ncbi:MFP1 attachment factor 1 [Linum perenne]
MTDSDATAATPSPGVPVKQSAEKLSPPSKGRSGNTLSIWPPSQRTRDAVIDRLIETLSAPSFLSKRYGTIPPEEAVDDARRIEEEAFATSTEYASAHDDGLEILQRYSKEVSKRMLETFKGRAESATAASDIAPATPELHVPSNSASASEEVPSSVESQA